MSLIDGLWCLQCMICRSTFLCTSSKSKLDEHIEGKHAGKATFEVRSSMPRTLTSVLYAWSMARMSTTVAFVRLSMTRTLISVPSA